MNLAATASVAPSSTPTDASAGAACPAVADAAADPAADFTLLFDAECPFCRLEVDWLLRREGARRGRLATIDIAAPDFDAARLGLTQEAVEAELHGLRPDGTVTTGMQSVREAYRAAGVGWMMAPTAWPILRPLCDLGYRLFARYRVPLGRLVGRSCDDACAIPPKR